MRELGTRNVILLTEGARMMGNYEEAYSYAEEQLYIDEAETIYEFCLWIDKEVGGASAYNIEKLFECWTNPKVPENREYVRDLKQRVKALRDLIG